MNQVLIYLMMAIKLNAQTGEEISRVRVENTPVYEQIADCEMAQGKTGIQHPVITPGGPPTITVIECTAYKATKVK